MHSKNTILTLIFSLIFLPTLWSTTIQPYDNLGLLIRASDAVVIAKVQENYLFEDGELGHFRSLLIVEQNIKGKLKLGKSFSIQALRAKSGALERIVWGDIDLKEGQTYLIFLYERADGIYLPMVMTYYVFQEFHKNGQDFLVPVSASLEINELSLPSGVQAPQLAAYQKTAFVKYAQKFAAQSTQIWNEDTFRSELPPSSFYGEGQAMPPSHCTYIFGAPPGRWNNFPTPLPVHYEVGGLPNCAASITRIQAALSIMNGVYPGINLTDGGTHNFSPSCVTGANGSEFTNWVQTNLGGSRHLVIQFDDPCDDIAPLNGCMGTLALGGMYAFGTTHEFNNMTWRQAAYGYVVTNEGLGSCTCTSGSFENVMIHEMTHALGIGHIAGSCTANMNPLTCVPPTNLDIECLNFTYLPQPLPVELAGFSGRQDADQVLLKWFTATETNNAYFTLERSRDSRSFETLATIPGYGFSQQEMKYSHIDKNPMPGTNYYRLSQTDYDGQYEVVGQIAVNFEADEHITLMPNPLKGSQLNVEYRTELSGELVMDIFDLNGRLWFRQLAVMQNGYNNIQLDLENLPNGVYAIRFIQNMEITTLRFVKS